MEKVIIVGLDLIENKMPIENSLDELEELVIAAGGNVEARIIQRSSKVNAAYYIGKGKAQEIKRAAEELGVQTVVFNNELSGAQLRNLEEIMDIKIVDRTNLILDIFANRASSKEGKLQVKLAQLQYRLPRLVGYSDYLSREGGGIGTRGPGEQKLETDRRHILREIDNIKSELRSVEKNRELKRKRRKSSNLPIVALVGYTNAGKSTLMNKMITPDEEDSGKEVYVKDMLFATLDTALRRGTLPNGQPFLLTDTVGFVSQLPTRLIEAFKGTLEEVKYADLLLHVVDASNPDLDIQLKTTYEILEDIETLDKPILTVFNKLDKVDIEDIYYDSEYVDEKIFISANDEKDIERLLESIEENLPQKYKDVTLKIPFDMQHLVNYFMTNYEVEDNEYTNNGAILKVNINQLDYERYYEYIIEE